MHTQLNIAWLVVSGLLLALTVVLTFMPRRAAAVSGYLAMAAAALSGAVAYEASTYIFWAVATLISVAINYMLPGEVARSRAGVPYISGGALAGTAVGMAIGTVAGVIVGSALGAFLGALAYGSTVAGRPMSFPSAKFFNYLAAKGLPVIVALSMVGIVTAGLLAM